MGAHPPDGYPARLATRCDVPLVRLDPADWVPRLGYPSGRMGVAALHLDPFEKPE